VLTSRLLPIFHKTRRKIDLKNHDRTNSPGGSTGVWKPRSGCRLVRKNSRRGGEVRVGFRGKRKNLQVSGLDHKIGGVGMVSKSVSTTVHMPGKDNTNPQTDSYLLEHRLDTLDLQ
jgi:hypothetical protein